MDKPQTLSVKEWIIRNMSTKMNIPERVIEEVVNHQFDSGNMALDRYNSLEFSGFGKYYFNVPKAEKRMVDFERMKAFYERSLLEELTEKKRHSIELKLGTVNGDIEILKTKMNRGL